MLNNDPVSAAGEFKALLEQYGSDPRVHYHLGSALLQANGPKSEALWHLQTAHEHPASGPWSELAIWAIANEKLRGGHFESAQELLGSVVSSSPDHGDLK